MTIVIIIVAVAAELALGVCVGRALKRARLRLEQYQQFLAPEVEASPVYRTIITTKDQRAILGESNNAHF